MLFKAPREQYRIRSIHSFFLQPQKLFDLFPVEADHRLTVDQGDGRALVAQRQQLFQRRRVLAHVLVNEGDSPLRKKLFLPVTGPSTRLGKHNY